MLVLFLYLMRKMLDVNLVEQKAGQTSKTAFQIK